MTAGPLLDLHMSSPEATTAFAQDIAGRLGRGDVLLLDGPIGAGKTHFTRALIQARLAAGGYRDDVPSPTFTLVQTYFDGQIEIWHADLYRVTNADEIAELGLEEAFYDALCIIEWPDRLGRIDIPGALTLSFRLGSEPGHRRICISGDPAVWAARLRAVDAPAEGADV